MLAIAIKKKSHGCSLHFYPVYGEIKTKTRGSDSKAGQTNYDDLYADILLWLKENGGLCGAAAYLEIGQIKLIMQNAGVVE
jgi:hypothetical protein